MGWVMNPYLYFQEQLELTEGGDNDDRRVALEAQDREYARALQAKEKARVRRAKEKARQRKLEKQRQEATSRIEAEVNQEVSLGLQIFLFI